MPDHPKFVIILKAVTLTLQPSSPHLTINLTDLVKEAYKKKTNAIFLLRTILPTFYFTLRAMYLRNMGAIILYYVVLGTSSLIKQETTNHNSR